MSITPTPPSHFAQPDFRPSKFIVCVNNSPEALVALKLAYSKAYKNKGQVAILHVITPPDFKTLGAVTDKMHNEQRKEAETLLKKMAEEAYESTKLISSLILREGEIGVEIVNAAMDDSDASMLVLGVPGDRKSHGKLTSWLAEQLGNGLFLPLLLVPGNLTDTQLQELI